eukprot:scaffold34007_cov66-Phaeocystis_antarctica.AAC.1
MLRARRAAAVAATAPHQQRTAPTRPLCLLAASRAARASASAAAPAPVPPCGAGPPAGGSRSRTRGTHPCRAPEVSRP